eukprot:TRINITY_DN28920_c0_g1_i2.p1 TRINITY_DN28920_c0_g1~~TRINITY_DN28920_c0_g1_i2.p1  ORF type:complete len:129 (-),score=12.36 TRINITY_DN28920_c0_g1_i2:84-470(-)
MPIYLLANCVWLALPLAIMWCRYSYPFSETTVLLLWQLLSPVFSFAGAFYMYFPLACDDGIIVSVTRWITLFHWFLTALLVVLGAAIKLQEKSEHCNSRDQFIEFQKQNKTFEQISDFGELDRGRFAL